MIHADLPGYLPSIISSPDNHEALIKIANYLELGCVDIWN
jgi:hypothetical protein